MKKIILIGGAPATGKSTLAKKLAKKYKIYWISTDFIRTWMKTLVSKSDYPKLFKFTDTTAEEHYKKYSIDETIEMAKLRNEDVWKGVFSFIVGNNDWDTYIIEGIAILPEFIDKLKDNSDTKIISIFIVDKNEKRIENIIYSRGLWGSADSYSDSVKKIEKEYLIKTNNFYLEESKKHKLSYFIIKENRDETISEIIKYLDGELEKLSWKKN